MNGGLDFFKIIAFSFICYNIFVDQPAQIINEPTLPTEATNPQPLPPNQKSSKIYLILLVVLLVGLVGAAVFWLGKSSNKPEVARPTPTLVPTFSEQTPTSDLTIGWKTYKNEELKISFDYPSQLRILESSVNVYVTSTCVCPEYTLNFLVNKKDQLDLFVPSHMAMKIYKCPSEMVCSESDLTKYLLEGKLKLYEGLKKAENKNFPYSLSEIMLGGKQVSRYDGDEMRGYDGETIVYYTSKDLAVIVGSLSQFVIYKEPFAPLGNAPYKGNPAFDQILTTFKFLP